MSATLKVERVSGHACWLTGREYPLNSVEQIRQLLISEDVEFATLARDCEFPRAYCFTRAMIAVALREGSRATIPIAALEAKARQRLEVSA
jgi:hypothetical protein